MSLLASLTSCQLASGRLASSSGGSGQIQITGNDDDDYNQDRRVLLRAEATHIN